MENTIPEAYRNRLYTWQGGGYDGCLWELNCGCVTAEGQWIPLYSTGHNGMDASEWFERKRKELLGKHEHDGSYASRLSDLMKQKAGKENEIFRGAVTQAYLDVMTGTPLRNDFREVGLLGDENIKETCRKLVSACCDMGFVASCLDGLQECGYRPWCKCSDCGEMFQLHDFDHFSDVLDADSYRGSGGLRIVYNRILCEPCRDATECPVCHGFRLPNKRSENDTTAYDFLDRLMYEWLGVCDCCASDFLGHVDQDTEDELTKAEVSLDDRFELRGSKLYDAVVEKRPAEINYIRDLLERDAYKALHGFIYDQDLFEERIKE